MQNPKYKIQNTKYKLILFSFIFLGLMIPAFFASAITGTIDGTNKYAWGENIGWINFGCGNCNVQVTDTAITGYAWSENYGWINLNPTNGGIINTNGTLSGNAWGESIGWIDFGTPGVSINTTTGQFSGQATETMTGSAGIINFGCTAAGCPVTTDWRPGGICGDAVCDGTETCATCDTDCGPCGGGTSHNECYNQQCISVPGLAANLCNYSDECKTHNECNEQKQCISVIGAGTDACTANADCAVAVTHNECNAQRQCIPIVGPGTDACTANADCAVAVTHKGCNTQNQCIPIIGPGTDTCTANSDCTIPIEVTHNECNAQRQCIPIVGPGTDACTANADCAVAVTHKGCNTQNQCIPIIGPGTDACTANADCAATVTHNECNTQRQCIPVIGSGTDACQTDTDCAIPVIASHNECNENKQCISVNGTGTNECQASYDCLSITEKIIEEVKPIKKIIDSPQGSVITKAVSTIGLVVAVVGAISSFRFFDLFLILLRSFGFLLTAVGLRKRIVPWGVVYDSVTKRPLDPAYVILKDLQGKTISSAITDMDGRYGFLVEPGVYQMQANKTNYSFPSQKLAGRTYDELHTDLYFGENITVNKSGEVIIKNIPLDPLKFDWNEFAKKDKNLMRFYSKWDAITRKFFDWLFVVGFIIAIIAFIFAPYPYNTIIMILYVLLLILRIFGVKPRAYGYIADRTTGIPLSFAIMRVFLPDSQTEITSKVADKYGKYYCLVFPGKYIVKIEKKNNDGSYSLAYTSPIIDVSKKGIIKEKFKV